MIDGQVRIIFVTLVMFMIYLLEIRISQTKVLIYTHK